MIAKRLENLISEAAKRGEAEMVQRFQVLREARRLPNSRGKNAEDLSLMQIVAGLLSIVSSRPSMAGTAVGRLSGLCPVGGSQASFFEAATFGAALELVLEDEKALASLIEIRVTDDEIYKNSSGRAAIIYKVGSKEKTVYFVRKEALSLLQLGAEKVYNPRETLSPVFSEVVFLPWFLQRIGREVKSDKKWADLKQKDLS